MLWFLLLATFLGHFFLWVGLINRIHAVGMNYHLREGLTLFCFGCLGAIPLLCGILLVRRGGIPDFGELSQAGSVGGVSALGIYLALCWIAFGGTLGRWIVFQLLRRPPLFQRGYRCRWMELDLTEGGEESEREAHHSLVYFPWNETLRLQLIERDLELPELARGLEGMTIAHLTDFHFTGRVGKSYFREVVAKCNALCPDLVVLTGDLIDKNACIDWIPETIGELKAPMGVFTILGNHDFRFDTGALRQMLEGSGIVDLGGCWREVERNGDRIILGGNERPWAEGVVDFGSGPASRSGGGPLRILLSHSPDQIGWARRQEVDLMLCGHTHGGQIRFPVLGGVLCPSLYGVRYARGLFYESPTIMHVSSGLSGKEPLRWNCPPELAILKLYSSKKMLQRG